MKRFLFALLLLPVALQAEPRLALTRESEAGFRELIRLAQQGALGNDVNNLNASIRQDSVQIELKQTDGGTRTLSLRPTSPTEKGSGFFRVEAGSGAAPADVEHLRSLLSRVFKADPFLVENDGMDGTRVAPPPPLAEALHNEGVSGAASALADRASGPTSRVWMLVTSIVPFLALLFALGAVWRASVRRP